MKKILGTIILLLVFTLKLSAQQQIDNIEFMVDNAETMQVLEKMFGVPYLLSNEKAIYKNVVFDGERYNEAECFFNKLKQFRRIGTRYNKLASTFINFIYVGCIMILIK